MRTARLVLLAGLCGCWGSSSYFPIPASVVVVNAPNGFFGAVPTGTAQVFVLGYYFSSDTVIQWDGRPQKTTFVGDSAPGITGIDPTRGPGTVAGVRVDLDADAARTSGTAKVTASNGSGPISQPLSVTILDAPFTFVSASPAQSDANAQPTSLTLTGTGFRPDSTATLDGAALTVSFVSSTTLTVQVPAALLVNAGDRFLQVTQEPCDPRLCVTPNQVTLVFSVGATGTRSIVQGNASDLVWDATHSLLFASLTLPSANNPILASIDPTSGSAGTAASVATAQDLRLKISAADQFLYAFQSGNHVSRYTLPGLTALTILSFPNFDSANAIAPAPDAAQTLAFAGFESGIIDGTTPRPTVAQTNSEPRELAWGADDTILYGASSDLLIYHVSSSGITGLSAVPAATFEGESQLVYDRTAGRIYGSAGENYDGQGGDPRPFPVPERDSSECKMAIDVPLGKGFFACIESTHQLTVRSFDLATQKFIARIVVANPTTTNGFVTSPFPSSLVRWGTSGLAIATNSGVYLYSGQFVH